MRGHKIAVYQEGIFPNVGSSDRALPCVDLPTGVLDEFSIRS
jgi:hypothetical protein